jgi:hypothetical protein
LKNLSYSTHNINIMLLAKLGMIGEKGGTYKNLEKIESLE